MKAAVRPRRTRLSSLNQDSATFSIRRQNSVLNGLRDSGSLGKYRTHLKGPPATIGLRVSREFELSNFKQCGYILRGIIVLCSTEHGKGSKADPLNETIAGYCYESWMYCIVFQTPDTGKADDRALSQKALQLSS